MTWLGYLPMIATNVSMLGGLAREAHSCTSNLLLDDVSPPSLQCSFFISWSLVFCVPGTLSDVRPGTMPRLFFKHMRIFWTDLSWIKCSDEIVSILPLAFLNLFVRSFPDVGIFLLNICIPQPPSIDVCQFRFRFFFFVFWWYRCTWSLSSEDFSVRDFISPLYFHKVSI